MSKTFFAVMIGTGIVAGAYFGAFYATQTALAHGAHCGSGANPPCNTGSSRYWALQKSDRTQPNGFSNGIRGGLSVSDVSMLDPSTTNLSECETIAQFGATSPGCDFLSHSLQVVDASNSQFITIGFTEGIMQSWSSPVIRTSPKVFTEVQSPCQGYLFFERPTSSLQDYLGLRWSGTSGVCANGQTYQKWYFLRGVNYAAYDVAFISSSNADFRAFTEHFDNTHMEPNGFQCFGRSSGCSEAASHELKLYDRPNLAWYAWTLATPTIIIDSQDDGGGYQYGQMNPYRSFFTGGQW